MKKKINSLTAGGQTRPEILPGDIFKDNRGERVTVKMVTDNRITYIREGYSGECVFPVERFEREFSLGETSDIQRMVQVKQHSRKNSVFAGFNCC